MLSCLTPPPFVPDPTEPIEKSLAPALNEKTGWLSRRAVMVRGAHHGAASGARLAVLAGNVLQALGCPLCVVARASELRGAVFRRWNPTPPPTTQKLPEYKGYLKTTIYIVFKNKKKVVNIENITHTHTLHTLRSNQPRYH